MNVFRNIGSVTLVAGLLAVCPSARTANVESSRARSSAYIASLINPPIGIQVLVQPWNPLAPDEDVPRSVLNQPTGISGPMMAAWDAARTILGDAKNTSSVPALLSKGGLIAPGVNLYDITLMTNPLSSITLQPSGDPGAFTMHWIIPRTRLDFRATTPGAVRDVGLTRDLDPKLSVQLDLDITLGFAVSEQPGQPTLQVTQTLVHITNPQIDSGNFSGDVVKAIANFCSDVAYGKNLNSLIAYVLGDKNIAADPQHGGLNVAGVHGIDVQGIANAHLQSINAQIAGSGAGGAVRAGLWVKNSGSGQMLSLLFAPKTVPLPPQNVAMSGSIVFDHTVDAAHLPANCNTVIAKDGVVVEVQTGPRKVIDIQPYAYGAKPTLRLANVNLGGGPVANHQCAFTLSGLVSLWPNNITFPAPAPATLGSFADIAHYLQLRPDGWTSPIAMTASVPNHNLLAGGSLAYNAGVGAQRRPGAAAAGFVNPGDPAYNPAAAASAWGARPGAGSAAPAPTGLRAWGGAGATNGLGTSGAPPASRLGKSVASGTAAAQAAAPAQQ